MEREREEGKGREEEHGSLQLVLVKTGIKKMRLKGRGK